MNTTALSLAQAIAAHQAGDIDKAEEAYQILLRENPQSADLLNLIGTLRYQQGRSAESEEFLRRGLKLRPGHPFLLLNLSNALRGQLRFTEALQICLEALASNPDYLAARLNTALIYRELGNTHQALDCYQGIVRDVPQCADGLLGIAQTYLLQQQHALAFPYLQELINQYPDNAIALGQAGNCALTLAHYSQAQSYFAKAIELLPADGVLYNALGVAKMHQSKLIDALQDFQTSIALSPSLAEAYANAGAVLLDLMRLAEAEKILRAGLRIAPHHPTLNANLLLSLNYRSDLSPDEICQAHIEWGARYKISSHRSTPQTGTRPLRIGYLSGDFRHHSVAYFFEPILRHHNREQFTIYCYSNVSRPDEVSKKLAALSDVWRPISTLSDTEAASLIQRDQIDILVDLSGHTADNRLSLCALKPAPIQCTYLGYPNTTGLPAIDFRLTDTISNPYGSDKFYSEKLVRLPSPFLCYSPPSNAPVPSPSTDLAHTIHFGSFNAAPKLNSRLLETWATLLQRLPHATLLIKARPFNDPRVKATLISFFVDRGIAPGRIDITGRTPDSNNHLTQYHQVDIALDTFPYNGTTTTCEALWMGVPVISMEGSTHTNCVGKSILNAIGYPQWCATTIPDYIQTAINLASAPHQLLEIKSTLRQTMQQSALCDGKRFTIGLEEAMSSMILHANQSQDFQDLHAPDLT